MITSNLMQAEARGWSWKLPATFNTVAMPFVLSLFVSALISGVSTVRSAGFVASVGMQWLEAWGASWAVALPAVLLALPVARRIVAAVVEPVRVSH